MTLIVCSLSVVSLRNTVKSRSLTNRVRSDSPLVAATPESMSRRAVGKLGHAPFHSEALWQVQPDLDQPVPPSEVLRPCCQAA